MRTARDIVGPSPWQAERGPIEREWFEAAWCGVPSTYVYRHYDKDDRLLYVGITVNPKRRAQGHKQKSPWWPSIARIDVSEKLPREIALGREWYYINRFEPPFNSNRENGYTGPGSHAWDLEEDRAFEKRRANDPEFWQREMDHVRRLFDADPFWSSVMGQLRRAAS